MTAAEPMREVCGLTLEQQMLVRKIKQQWGDTLDKNLDVGDCLLQLHLSKKDWRLNLLNLPMTYSWGRRLMKIARDDRIRTNLDRMPNARDTLHEIVLLTPKQFTKALGERIINPTCTRHDIHDFRRREQGISAKLHVTVTFEHTGKPGRPEEEALGDLAELMASVQKMIDTLFPTVKIKKQIRGRRLQR